MSRASALLTLVLFGYSFLGAQAPVEGAKPSDENAKISKEHLDRAPGKANTTGRQKKLTRTPTEPKPSGNVAKAESDKNLANYKHKGYPGLPTASDSGSKVDSNHGSAKTAKTKTAGNDESENAEKEHEHHGEVACDSLKTEVAKEKCRREEKLRRPAVRPTLNP